MTVQFPIMPVILWTDALFFTLIIILILSIIYIYKNKQLHERWRNVVFNKRGMASLIILCMYGGITTLDSIHFKQSLDIQATNNEVQYSSKVESVLDILLSDLRRSEKTYSAPFALFGYSKETISTKGNKTDRDYPRLQYSGNHLSDPVMERSTDILSTIVLSIVQTVIIVFFLFSIFTVIYARSSRRAWLDSVSFILRGRSQVPWRLCWSMITLLLMVCLSCYHLGSDYHILGTDKIGDDVFVQALKSIRTGLIIGTVTTLVMLPFAILLGMSAGYFRGWIDDVIQYTYTTLSSIPGVLLIAASILMLQVFMSKNPELFDSVASRIDARLLALCFILGITSWTGLCRLLRAETLKIRELDYVNAAVALGVNHFKILQTHILPNVMHLVLIALALDFSGLVLAEAVLSYVGIGVDPSASSWGNMINQARLELAREPVVWWSLAGAFVMMFILVLSANLLADAIRDAFDPKLSRL